MRRFTKRPVVPVTPFQRDWISDKSRFKIAVKSRRIGLTFAATLEIALDAVEKPTKWMIVSRTQDAAVEALGECANHLRFMKRASKTSITEERTGRVLDGLEISKYTIALPNGSQIMAMTAHPDATRGFGGNILLDEHAFHEESKELWKGAIGSTIRGHRLVVISTPNYQIGNYYRLAVEAGLARGHAPEKNPEKTGIWSAHWIDIHMAIPQLEAIGVSIDADELRTLAGDDDTWQQEFCCQFASASEMWLSLDLITLARSPMASFEWDPERPYETDLYLGGDIGRRRDRTALWIDQRINNVAVCRGVILLDKTPFEQQYEILCGLLKHPKLRRACIDETGIGMALVERLKREFGSKVEGITFTSAIKESMSVLVRKRFEERLDLIPERQPIIERDLAAIKRIATPHGNLRFDAERAENSHADIYWAKALADAAAEQPPSSFARDAVLVSTPRHPEFQPIRVNWRTIEF